MKILLLSDLHGNFPALEAVWQQEKDSDLILCAGDLVDWGFYPKEVLDWCRQYRVVCVAGNHDHDICQAYRAMKAGDPQAVPPGTFAAYTLKRLSPEDIAWLEALPESRTVQADSFAFFIKHYYKDDLENRNALLERWIHFEAKLAFDEVWPPDLEAKTRTILTGHSHQCCLYQAYNGAYFLNPGSISYRVCSDSRSKGADYAVIENEQILLRHVDYDRQIFVPLLAQTPLRPDVRQMETYHLVEDCEVGEP